MPLYGFAGLGLAGSVLAAVAAPRALENRHAGWWYAQIADQPRLGDAARVGWEWCC